MVTCLKGKAVCPKGFVRPGRGFLDKKGCGLSLVEISRLSSSEKPDRRQKTTRLSHRSGKLGKGKANNNNLAFIV